MAYKESSTKEVKEKRKEYITDIIKSADKEKIDGLKDYLEWNINTNYWVDGIFEEKRKEYKEYLEHFNHQLIQVG